MPIVFKELRRSNDRDRTTSSISRNLAYKAWYSPQVTLPSVNLDDVENQFYSYLRTKLGLAPTADIYVTDNLTGYALVLSHASVLPHEDDEQVFDIQATFSIPEAKPSPDHGEFSFDISTTSTNVTQSYSQLRSSGAPQVPGINFDGENVQGVDIVVPTFSWRETHLKLAATVDLSYVNNLISCAGTMNSLTFRNCSPGEALFVGATGSLQGQYMNITYCFQGQKNSTVAGLSKRGWDYVWRLYEKNEDTASKWIVPAVAGTYVEQVYLMTNFTALLGI